MRMADSIQWGGNCTDPFHSFLNIVDDFVSADEKNHVFWSERDAGNTISYHVHVYQLPFLRECVASG